MVQASNTGTHAMHARTISAAAPAAAQLPTSILGAASKTRHQKLCAAACLSAMLCGGSAPVLAEQIKPVFDLDLPNVAGKTFKVIEVSFAAGTKANAHRHGNAFVYAYVLSGSIRSQLAGEPARIYRAGQGWFEPPGAHHILTQNLSRKKSARLLVVFVANIGEPTKTSDAPQDPSVARPENRVLVELGGIRIDRIAPDFAPTDPMFAMFQGTYPPSFKHRQ
jgi:quercetin dioxygenase-like cupin family protein